jgi:hypothetical protein
LAQDFSSLFTSLSHNPEVYDLKSIKSEEFEANPFAIYRQLLEKFYGYTQFSESQEFLAIIVEEISVLGNKNLPDYLKSSLTTYGNFSSNNKYFRITIPQLDAALPDLRQELAKEVFLQDISRIAVYEGGIPGNGSLRPGSIVRISDAIISAKLRKPCTIRSIYQSADILQDVKFSEDKIKNAFKECLKQRLPVKPPEEKVANQQPKPEAPAQITEKNIFSKVDSPNDSYRKFKFANQQESQPQPDQEKNKIEDIRKSMPNADDLAAACDLGPVQSPAKQGNTESKANENAFVRDSKTNAVEQNVENIGKASIFNSLSTKKEAKIITASKNLDSIGPIYEIPEDFREPTMIVVKTVQYTYAEDYFEKIKSDKVPAAHFCIDLNGDIYQFTDTKNLVRSYNPTMDEKSIYIGVVNIPFRNSTQTIEKLPFLNSTSDSSFLQNGGKILALYASSRLDQRKLKRFYDYRFDKYSSKPKKDVIGDTEIVNGKTENTFTLSDGRNTFPNYRFDYTEEQKISLISLISALSKSYKIKTDLPSIRGFDPEVASGDFNGIVCPLHFLYSDMEPLNFYTLMQKLPKGS